MAIVRFRAGRPIASPLFATATVATDAVAVARVGVPEATAVTKAVAAEMVEP